MAVSEIRRLTLSRRVQQTRRAAAIAALVALYYRTRVKVDDPRSIERWIELMIPKIIEEQNKQAEAAARYGNTLRKLELGPGPQSYTFEPVKASSFEQLDRSLRYLGPEREIKKVLEIEQRDLAPTMKRAMIEEAKDLSARAVAGSVARHTQNGARQTLYDNAQADPVCLGYLRVTKTDPCYFCAALASRGIIYGEDSFDVSDPRFTGTGTAKVHDSCACHLKPVYTDNDEFKVDTANFEALWFQWSGPTENSNDPMYNFRRAYEDRSDGPSLRAALRQNVRSRVA